MRLFVFLLFICFSSFAQEKLNVLFISVDDLRCNIKAYGDELAVTPGMDRLSREGTSFLRAYCQVAVCNPSRASVMTRMRQFSSRLFCQLAKSEKECRTSC